MPIMGKKFWFHTFFKLLFGCPMANFEPLLRRQPHWPNVNHCVFEVGSLSPAECLIGFETGTFWCWLKCLNPLGHSPQIDKNWGMISSDNTYKNIHFIFIKCQEEYLTSRSILECFNIKNLKTKNTGAYRIQRHRYLLSSTRNNELYQWQLFTSPKNHLLGNSLIKRGLRS